MRQWKLSILLLLSAMGFCIDGHAQEKHEIAAIVQYLSSERLEGREIGTQGAEIAAEYIASQFLQAGLQPYKRQTGNLVTFADYYQSFSVQRYSVTSCIIKLVPDTLKVQTKKQNAGVMLAATQYLPSAASVHLIPGEDFIVENALTSLTIAEQPVWAGYGINEPSITFQSYNQTEVAGRVVVIRQGYPGMHEKWGKEWNKYKTDNGNSDFGVEYRCKQLARAGASMVIILPEGYPNVITSAETQQPQQHNSVEPCNAASLYQDAVYLQVKDTVPAGIPLLYLSRSGAAKYYATGDNPKLELQLHVHKDVIPALNVVGLLPGKDTSKTIIIGAHFDHLGKRGTDVYAGADDNASGVAGVILLANQYTSEEEQPDCNMIFATWTGEEKGMLGSEYFASLIPNPASMQLYINMDMISRSAADDITLNIVSIGTRAADEHLRKTATDINKRFNNMFSLDLWEVDGHHGSDYASFTKRNIPVATFFSGFHNDYHSPCDTYQRINPEKAVNILHFIQRLLEETK